MNFGDDNIAPTPTRLNIQRFNSWYALAFVTTSLQVQGKELDLADATPFKVGDFANAVQYGAEFKNRMSSSETTFTSYQSDVGFGSVETVLGSENLIDSENDISIRPQYTKEFKIKVRALKIDKSLPKIFVD